jgi:hypothetical protein
MARAEFEQNRQNSGALETCLHRHAGSDLCLWAIARPAPGDKPLDEAELAMIAQIVAPRLAGMTPSSVHRRYEELSRRTGTATGQKRRSGVERLRSHVSRLETETGD